MKRRLHSPQEEFAVGWHRDLIGLVYRGPRLVLVGMVRCYQYLISPLLGPRCRFHPTCSEYFIGAVHKYGAVRGALRGLRRIGRCHPWHPGGHDPP